MFMCTFGPLLKVASWNVRSCLDAQLTYWFAVKELKLSYHNIDTL